MLFSSSRSAMIALTFCAGACSLQASAVMLGQVDTFDDDSNANWNGSLFGLSNQADGGPTGDGDNFLQVVSTGTAGSGSRLVTRNNAQWTGDYLAEGITSISLDANNLGANALDLRIAVRDVDGAWFASTDATPLAVASGWTALNFSLDSLTQISGAVDLDTVLGAVAEFRILSSVDLPTLGSGFPQGLRGDTIAATLGLDNITAVGAANDPADLDLDGDVDDADFALFFAAFSGPGVPTGNPAADLDGDNDTDDADFGLAFAAFTGPGGVASVPEPTSLALIGLGGLLLAQRRRA